MGRARRARHAREAQGDQQEIHFLAHQTRARGAVSEEQHVRPPRCLLTARGPISCSGLHRGDQRKLNGGLGSADLHALGGLLLTIMSKIRAKGACS